MAQTEGVFCEPASAAGVAGVLKFAADLPPGPVVCTLTGHGLKDPDTAVADFPDRGPIAPTLEAAVECLGW